MRQEFNLDSLTTQGLEEIDPEARVVNPEARQLNKEMKLTKLRLGRLRNRLAEPALSRNVRMKYESESAQAESEAQTLKTKLEATPTHVKNGQLSEPLQTLPSVDRLIYDTIRMMAYRTEVSIIAKVMSCNYISSIIQFKV